MEVGEQKGRSLAKNLYPRNEAQKHGPTQRPSPGDLAWSHTQRLLKEQCQGPQEGNEGIWNLHCPCGNFFPSGLSAIVETMMTGREGGWNSGPANAAAPESWRLHGQRDMGSGTDKVQYLGRVSIGESGSLSPCHACRAVCALTSPCCSCVKFSSVELSVVLSENSKGNWVSLEATALRPLPVPLSLPKA